MTATPKPPDDPSGADEGTPEDDATVVVDRTDDDHTVVVERTEDDHTVVVKPVEATTSASSSSSSSTSGSQTTSASKFSGSASENSSGPMLKVPARTRTRTRPELRPAPVPAGFGRQAREAIGVGVIMSSDAVPAAPMMATGHAIEAGAASTRAATPSMPSVERSSRRTAVASLLVVAGACVVSLGGLIALIANLISNR